MNIFIKHCNGQNGHFTRFWHQNVVSRIYAHLSVIRQQMSAFCPFRGGVAESRQCLLFLPFFLDESFPKCEYVKLKSYQNILLSFTIFRPVIGQVSMILTTLQISKILSRNIGYFDISHILKFEDTPLRHIGAGRWTKWVITTYHTCDQCLGSLGASFIHKCGRNNQKSGQKGQKMMKNGHIMAIFEP